METEEAAETAIKELNGREVKGRPMKVGSVFSVLCSVLDNSLNQLLTVIIDQTFLLLD